MATLAGLPVARRRSAKGRRRGLARMATLAGRERARRRWAGPKDPMALRPRTDTPDDVSRGHRPTEAATCLGGGRRSTGRLATRVAAVVRPGPGTVVRSRPGAPSGGSAAATP